MYGMMPSAKIVSRRKLPPLNKSIMPSSRALVLIEQLRQDIGIDSRRGNMRANAIHREHRQRKEHTLPQIRNAEDIAHGLEKRVHDNLFHLATGGGDLFFARTR